MVHFAHDLDGGLYWPHTGWALVGGSGILLVTCGVTAVLGLAVGPGKIEELWQGRAWRAWVTIVAGSWLWSLDKGVPYIDPNPLRSAPVVLFIVIAVAGWQLWRNRDRRTPSQECQPRWTPQNRPLMDRSKPATTRVATETQ